MIDKVQLAQLSARRAQLNAAVPATRECEVFNGGVGAEMLLSSFAQQALAGDAFKATRG